MMMMRGSVRIGRAMGMRQFASSPSAPTAATPPSVPRVEEAGINDLVNMDGKERAEYVVVS